MSDIEKMVQEISFNIGGLVGSTQNKEAIKLLNDMMIMLFKIQDLIEKPDG